METNQKGNLILKSVPDSNVQKDAVRYLARVIKNTPQEKIIAKIRKAPCILLKNVPEKAGRKIASGLQEIGAIAAFEPYREENAEEQDLPRQEISNTPNMGKLTLKAIPTQAVKSEIITYLSKIIKKDSPEQIAKLVRIVPVTLFKNISEKNGRKIEADLRKIGAIAAFDPLVPQAEIPVVAETKKPRPLEQLLILARGKWADGTLLAGLSLIILLFILVPVFIPDIPDKEKTETSQIKNQQTAGKPSRTKKQPSEKTGPVKIAKDDPYYRYRLPDPIIKKSDNSAPVQKPDQENTQFIEAKVHFKQGKSKSHLEYKKKGKWPVLGSRCGYESFDMGKIGGCSDDNTIRAKNTREAIKEFESAISIYPDYYEAMLFLACCLRSPEINETELANNLLGKIVDKCEHEKIKFIAADALDMVDQVPFSHGFVKKYIGSQEYFVKKSYEELDQLREKIEKSPLISDDLKIRFIEASEKTAFRTCQYMAKTRGAIKDYLFISLWNFNKMTSALPGFDLATEHRDKLVDYMYEKFPQFAPYYFLTYDVDYPGFMDKLSKTLDMISNDKLQPADPLELCDRLGALMCGGRVWMNEELLAAHRDEIFDSIFKKYPQHAPIYIFNCMEYPGYSDKLMEIVRLSAENKLKPYPKFNERLVRHMCDFASGGPHTNYEAAREIGEYFIKKRSLSKQAKVCLAFCYNALGQTEKGVALFNEIGNRDIEMHGEGHWGRPISYNNKRVYFNPAKKKKEWLRKLGKTDREDDISLAIELKTPIVKLSGYLTVDAIAVEDGKLWMCANKLQDVYYPSGIYNPTIYNYNPETEELNTINLPVSITGMGTSIVVLRNTIWLGTDEGLVEYNIRSKKLRHYKKKQGLLKPDVRSLYRSGNKLYAVSGSGIGYLDLEKSSFQSIAAQKDIVTIIPSNKGIWALMYSKLLHFSETGKQDTELKWKKRHSSMSQVSFRCLALNSEYLVIGKNLQTGREQVGLRDVGKGGIIICDKSSPNSFKAMEAGASFIGPDVFSMAFVGKNLWVGGRGFLAVVDPVKARVTAQLEAGTRTFLAMFPGKKGLWIAADNQVYYMLYDDAGSVILQTTGAQFAEASALSPDSLSGLVYDGTQASLEKIQKAVIPAAMQGNIIALNICRQTMYGLGQEIDLKKITMELARPFDEELLQSWVSIVRQKAGQGDPFFKVVMGILFLEGKGMEKDNQRFFALLEEAATLGYHDAFAKLGNLHSTGIIVKKNMEKAVEYYTKAGELGSAFALYNIGCIYNNETEVSRNVKKAMMYWKQSAEMGHALAQYNLGLFYAEGEGGEYNPAEGKQWLEKSAAQGYTRAQEYLDKHMP